MPLAGCYIYEIKNTNNNKASSKKWRFRDPFVTPKTVINNVGRRRCTIDS